MKYILFQKPRYIINNMQQPVLLARRKVTMLLKATTQNYL